MFSKCQVGDSVWSCIKGWGVITKLYTEWDDMKCMTVDYTYHHWKDDYKVRNGRPKNDFGDKETVYHNPLKLPRDEYVPPVKKDIPVDSKMIVKKMWIDSEREYKRHFSHYDDNDGVFCFMGGCTSFSTGTSILEHYEIWELVE